MGSFLLRAGSIVVYAVLEFYGKSVIAKFNILTIIRL